MTEPKLKRTRGYFYPDQFIAPGIDWRIILGARGVGKSIGTLAYYIHACAGEDNPMTFIYLRRWQNEVDTLSIDTGLLSELTGYEVTMDFYKDDTGARYKAILADGELVGKVLALSVTAKFKSNAFPNTACVVFDEFIPLDNRYLKNEFNLFLQFLKTVYRNDSQTGFPTLFLANSTKLDNPYLVNLNLLPGRGDKTATDKKRGVKVWMYETPVTFKEMHEGSKLDALVEQYELLHTGVSSSVGNEFSDEGSAYMVKLTGDAKQVYTFFHDGIYYYGYNVATETPDGARAFLVISRKGNKEAKVNAKVTTKYKPDLSNWRTVRKEWFRFFFDKGMLAFDNAQTRGIWLSYMVD